jgi:Histidine kinase-, DNA gyrase B-, and HSP90-like ATPase
MMDVNQEISQIGIRPEVTMLSVLRHLNYKPWFAIAEFIDNALQSYLTNQQALENTLEPNYKLCVQVRLDMTAPGQLVITDNAAGISSLDFPRAFRAAQVPTDRTGLSEFGMGMKSAACWFAKSWSVRTKALGEGVERTISFDIGHIVDNRIESLDTSTRVVTPPSPYTVVTMRGLHHIPQGRTIGKIKEHLASIYRVFLRDGRLTLSFNDEELSYETTPILKALPYDSPGVPRTSNDELVWKKPIELDFGSGQRVTGFAALREVGSTPYAGFALFRRDRLIEGSHDETYRPSYIFKNTNSYPYQRLFGELHVEGFEVSHTKDGFRWEEYEDIFLDYLKEQLEETPLNLLAQAENYRALPSKKSIGARAVSATDSVATHFEEEVTPLLIQAKENPVSPAQLPPVLLDSQLKISERVVTVDDGTYSWIVTLRTTVNAATEDWVSISKEDTQNGDEPRARRLGIELSLAHPFSTKFLGANNENIEVFLRVAVAVGVALVLSEDVTGNSPESVLYHFNYLLRGALTSAMN